MGNGIAIKPMTKADIPIYGVVIRRSFMTVAKEFCITVDNFPRYTGFITDDRLEGLYSENYHPYGCFIGDVCIGFVSINNKGGGIFEMNNLAVLPEYRHFGYGKRLLAHCQAAVRSFCGHTIEIGIIEENAKLRNWYIENNFTHKGTKRFDGVPFTVGYMEWNDIR